MTKSAVALTETRVPSLRPDELHDEDVIEAIRVQFESTYLTAAAPSWLHSPAGQAEVRREIQTKYNDCVRYILPWVLDAGIDLAGRTVAEIGCGTGSKAAAFALRAERLLGCDHSEPHLAAAKARFDAMGIQNATVVHDTNEGFLEHLERSGEPVDVFLLYAVLEHLTLEERLYTLRKTWKMLPDGGAIVIGETPNRLLPWDFHSSRLPFFNMLPDELAAKYYERSPRDDYVQDVRHGPLRDDPVMALTRQGRGVSYHEFELTIGDLDTLATAIVADGFDLAMLNLDAVHPDELTFRDFVARERLGIPPAFHRYSLALVLQKGRAAPRRGSPFTMAAARNHLAPARLHTTSLAGPGSFVDLSVESGTQEVILGFAGAAGEHVLVSAGAGAPVSLDLAPQPGHFHDEVYFRFTLPSPATRVRVERPGNRMTRALRILPPRAAAASSRLTRAARRVGSGSSPPVTLTYGHAR